MAGPFEQSAEELQTLDDALFLLPENVIANSNQHFPSSSTSNPPVSKTAISEDALITNPSNQLELRQNNPQDCQNLIIASVDRATVEISRTIIALNATFSQRLQQASISASNGIKSAQDSASLSIRVVVQSADIATSSASFMVTIANRAVVSATSALADVSQSSSSDVATLSSSMSLLQARLVSLQASASAAIAAAQKGSLRPTATQTVVGGTLAGQPLPSFQSGISLTPGQVAGIIVGGVAASALLSLAVYFTLLRLRKRKHDGYKDEKSDEGSSKAVYSRSSSGRRTANISTTRFNPSRSSKMPPPIRSALKNPSRKPVERQNVPQISPLQFRTSNPRESTSSKDTAVLRMQGSRVAAIEWPLPPSSLNRNKSIPSSLPTPQASSALVETNNVIETDGIVEHDSRDKQRSPNPFSDPREHLSDDLDDPFEDAPGIYFLSDTQAFDFGIAATSTAKPPHHARNLINDSSTTSMDGSIDTGVFRNQSSNEFHTTKREEPQSHIAKPAQNEHIDGSVRTKIPDPEPTGIPSLLQMQIAFVPKSASRFDAKSQTSDYNTARATNQDTAGFVANQPSFLTRYSPQISGLEKAPSPPPRRSPSLGSVRPLRKMLPPRQKTVSPPRRVYVDNGQGSNLSQPRPLQVPTVTASLPADLKTAILEETEVSWPSSQQSRGKTLSPLGRNPVNVEDPAKVEVAPDGDDTKEVEQTESDEGECRGRSMIRTSDIIEARLSVKSQVQENRISLQDMEGREAAVVQKSQPITSSTVLKDEVNIPETDTGKSPLRRNPVDISSIPILPLHRRTKTLPPPRQHINREHGAKRRSRSLSPVKPVERFQQLDRSPTLPTRSPLRLKPVNLTKTKRNSRSFSPPKLSHPSIKSISRSISREGSPLRRNPTRTDAPTISVTSKPTPSTSTSTSRVPKFASNGLFAKNLSKFQNLSVQNPQDTIMASTEVTQRAIAGIYIPGSLREQAVRTVSKSRERI